ncbi:AraC family transcriptional regulator [bacterium 336/3]|nr:AraC family transcriptional regulator [bacterium 336/3]
MNDKTVLVKNMVCNRCILAVEQTLQSLQIPFLQVKIGEIQTSTPLEDNQKHILTQELSKIGLEIIDNKQTAFIEKIKQLVILKARNEVKEEDKKKNLSVYLIDHIHQEYSYVSSQFSEIEGRTIENFFIEQRIEKAKELLVYNEYNLSQIAFELDYSSAAHLSSQFKKVTGLTPSHFKEIGSMKRKALDKI